MQGNCSSTPDVALGSIAGCPLLPTQCLLIIHDGFLDIAHSMRLSNIYLQLADTDSSVSIEDTFSDVDRDSQLMISNGTLQVCNIITSKFIGRNCEYSSALQCIALLPALWFPW